MQTIVGQMQFIIKRCDRPLDEKNDELLEDAIN